MWLLLLPCPFHPFPPRRGRLQRGRRGGAPAPADPPAGAPVAPPSSAATVPAADVFGLASWMRWWMPPAPQAPTATVPGLSISAERLAELQDGYINAMTAIWNDFIAHPDRAAAPIR